MGFFKKFGENTMKPPHGIIHLLPKGPPKPKVAHSLLGAAKVKGPGSIPRPKGPLIGGAGGMRSMKEGGMVKQTKPHLLHKGEMVIPAEHASIFKKLLKK